MGGFWYAKPIAPRARANLEGIIAGWGLRADPQICPYR